MPLSAGATCSNNLTEKPFPSLFESQLPLFLAELHNGSLRVNQQETVYTLWIGTNDVGVGALRAETADFFVVEEAC